MTSRRPAGAEQLEMIGSFESTYLPAHDRDVIETTEHDRRFEADIDLLTRSGVTRLRYPVRWHRVESEEGALDWSGTDRTLGLLRDRGLRPIVDLVHHTSYPAWLTGGFADPRFGAAYLRYAEAFARRYDWVEEYTLFNEPFSTLFLCGHEAIWPPYTSGLANFVDLIANVMPAVAEASRLYQELLPLARHVWVDTCEHHTGSDESGRRYADFANERRFLVLDAFLGRNYDESSPLGSELAAVGGERLRDWTPGSVDVLGLDYYAHCQWNFSLDGGTAPTGNPLPLADQIEEYWHRYDLPCMLTETNVRGSTSDRATWLKYVAEQCETAIDRGVPLEAVCWFPLIDSTDWNSLLFRCDGHVDPVGVYWLDEHLDRRESVMSESFAVLARGGTSAVLPAFRLSEAVAERLAGYAAQMAHWEWREPPSADQGTNLPRTSNRMELRVVAAE
ncbi:MAG TPA: family 1 glycosylhydrolase [Naasia sp.]|jgi:beta-glucosidase/6-phospho-beta-glucosidase/beta-galactosidase